ALAIFIGFGTWLVLGFIGLTLWVWILVLLALIAAAALAPIVCFLQRPAFPPGGWHLPRGAAVVITILVVLIGGAIGAYLIGGMLIVELATVSAVLPTSATTQLDRTAAWLRDIGFPPSVVPGQRELASFVKSVVSGTVGFIAGAIPSFLTFFTRFFIVLTLAAFLVVEADSALSFFESLFPVRQRPVVHSLMVRSGQTMGMWVLGTLIESTIVGVLSGIAAWLIGLPGPALLGVLAALIQFIPITGPILMVIPGFLLGIAISPLLAIEAVVAYTIIAEVNASLLAPWIARWSVSLSPLIVVIAIPLGGALYGTVGALIAIPVIAAIQIFVVDIVIPWLHRIEGQPISATTTRQTREPGRAA
ncbi:MAG TPA: AI-2E family transporter, partial [Chloroflexota bacterium]|nr:AI-2E family transporter [Chloroflexota bacterium]